MATQEGILPIKGTIGNITFFKSKDGYLVRQKGGVSASQIANSPAYQRTRENGAEFGRACKAGKTLRTAFRAAVQNVSDRRMVSRLAKKMMEVIHADSTSDRGLRNVIDGEATLLEGFEFNENGNLGGCFAAAYTAAIDRVSGKGTISIPAFLPSEMLQSPGGTTHFKMIAAIAAIDFENQLNSNDAIETALLPWDNTATAAISLEATITANSTHPLFLVLGISFYQEMNGKNYSLNNGGFNCLAIVKVDTGV